MYFDDQVDWQDKLIFVYLQVTKRGVYSWILVLSPYGKCLLNVLYNISKFHNFWSWFTIYFKWISVTMQLPSLDPILYILNFSLSRIIRCYRGILTGILMIEWARMCDCVAVRCGGVIAHWVRMPNLGVRVVFAWWWCAFVECDTLRCVRLRGVRSVLRRVRLRGTMPSLTR